ncbi:hypothetical protein PPGU19_011630 [Paraburkholderia sp. PGU19]|uniref:hypothetical protein n=1 Tax=Paraburkholderia sp. PGU19 TaxID=2735434 RepID=UPI0015D97CD2|nr:hypothetical protein [Paraburkholderia sp. PGU19]BCF96594.1 hypothetical protein PPGU19_011630 [Paraburkholderia sp. PGU19]
MAASNELRIMRRGGDLFFNHVYDDTILMIQVTHECLADVFGSEGAPDQDVKTLQANLSAIVKVATEKALRGEASPIRVTVADF